MEGKEGRWGGGHVGSSSTGSGRDAGSVPPVPAAREVTNTCDVGCVHTCICGRVARQDLTHRCPRQMKPA